MLNKNGTWIVISILIFALLGVMPQVDSLVRNAIALSGMSIIGGIAISQTTTIQGFSMGLKSVAILGSLFCLYAMISVILEPRPSSLTQIIRPSIYIYLLLFCVILIPNTVSPSASMRGVVLVSTLIASIGILGIIAYPFSSSGLELVQVLPVNEFLIFGQIIRRPVAVSVFSNPNRLAIFCIPGIIGGISLYQSDKNISWLFFSIICIVATILTGSRTPIILFPFVIFTSYLLIYKGRAALSLIIVLMFLLPPVIVVTAKFNIGIVPIFSEPRAELWDGAIDALIRKPWVGYGFGNFSDPLTPFIPDDFYGSQPHNAFLMLGISSGIPIMVSYFSLLFISIMTRIRAEPREDLLPWIVLSIVYLFIHWTTSFSMFALTPTSILIGLTLGYLIRSGKDSPWKYTSSNG